jgi:hypothetical protein
MGYASYALQDGREAGYSVAATCDADQCTTTINRGLDFLCGQEPGVPDPAYPGCRNYFCEPHQQDHECPNPTCGQYPSSAEQADGPCELTAAHERWHVDGDGTAFTRTEDDDT